MNLHAEMTDAAEAAARTVAGVDASQLPRPTPCTEWDTRALLNHLIVWTAYSLEARAHGGSVSPELIERDFAAEPGFAVGYRAQLDRALAAWSDPGVWQGSLDVMGTATPAADVAALNLAELVLHGWDLAAATGQRYTVSDRAAAAALTAVTANADLFRQYKGFADPVELAPGAPVLDQVLALSGRDPGWGAGPALSWPPYRYCMINATAVIVADLAPAGVLRVAINLGNPVLAQGTPTAPSGVTIDIAREIAARLGVTAEFDCVPAARDSFQASVSGQADLCFLAIEPARAVKIAFTAPYVIIEGVYAVAAGSPLDTVAAVDHPGLRVGVRQGSAYDLFLSRTLRHAALVRAAEVAEVTGGLLNGELDAAAGIKEQLTEFTAAHPGTRLVPGRFMEIRQAVGTARAKRPETTRFLHDLVEELKASGFVADALRRSGQTAPVAPQEDQLEA